MKNRIILYVLLLLTSPFLYGKSACIIIHGTWAAKENWHKPGGSFFEEVLASSKKHDVDEVVSFTWSGKNNDRERRKAAMNLSGLIQEYDDVVIIAHSHGANVGIIASQLLDNDSSWNYFGPERYKIRKFYALGVPVAAYECFPNMNVIKYFYNLFSFEDFVQPVFGIFGRTFFVHDRVANISVSINQKEPDHSGLHEPIIGTFILDIHEQMRTCDCPLSPEGCCSCRKNFSFNHPLQISFDQKSHTNLICNIDHERERLLQRDAKLMRLLLDAIMRKPKNRRD